MHVVANVDWGSVPQWITALGSLLLGLGVTIVGVVQWRREGYVPIVRAWRDAAGECVGIRVENRGRGRGFVERIVVIQPHRHSTPESWPLRFPGFPEENWARQALDGADAMVVYALRQDGEPLPGDLRVEVWLGAHRRIKRQVRQDSVSYSGLSAHLPAEPDGS